MDRIGLPRRLGAALGVVALALLVGACVPGALRARFAGGPEAAARAYLDAWAQGDLAGQRSALVEVPPDFDAQHADWRQRLGVVASRFERLRTAREGEDVAIVTVRAVHLLRGLGDWPVEARLRLERVAPGEARWRVRWAPDVLHPQAARGDRFARSRSWGPRGALLDAGGRPLVAEGEIVSVGVEPGRVKDRAAVAEALRAQLGVDPARVAAALDRPGQRADAFVPVADAPPDRYPQVRAALAPVPGIFFRKRASRLSSGDGLAAHTIGRVGEVTAEGLAALGAPYQTGDVVGLSGLERALERRLAGAPAGEVRLVRPSGERILLHRFPGAPGASVRTTLRLDVQAAAEAALAGIERPAALVAVEASSGAVVALASRPLADPLHRAVVGLYPPGSTFKVVTTEALLARGVAPATRVSCPAEAQAGDRRFRNFEGEVLGATTFRRAFAHSCNTAFVTLAAQLDGEALGAAARRFGFDVEPALGLPAPRSRFPEPDGEAERAAAALGQGRVLATPLHMASVAAAAGAGVWRAPRLLADAPAGREVPLSEGAAEALRGLMRAVVTEGTARAAADVPGLAGKTGTAEFGSGEPPATHAWFIGLHRGLGFAVLVEGGGVGGRVAAPIAARFASAVR